MINNVIDYNVCYIYFCIALRVNSTMMSLFSIEQLENTDPKRDE